MKTINKLLLAAVLLMMTIGPVFAEDPREVCTSNAQAEGIPAAEMEDYIRSCIEDMSGEGAAAESTDMPVEGDKAVE